MKWLSILLLASCSSDVSIMKQPSEPSEETGVSPTEPGSIPDTNEPDSTMTELTIGFGDIYFRQIACPACVGESSEFDITANLKLHHPTAGDYNDWLTPVGTCTTQLIQTHVSNQPLVSTQPANFNSIALNPSGQGTWSNSYLYEYQYERNTSYTVISEHGTIPNAFQSLEGFDSIEPYTLLWIDPSYAFEAVISKSGTSFSWAPVVSNSFFEIMVAVYSPDGSQLLGIVSCMENDSGYMFVPGTYFQSYPHWSLAAVHLTRHRTGRVAAPELNGYFQSHLRWEVVGTGHIE
jgi:hypothetical protein